MRLLGIDFGTKRIGLAISDESATLAFPHIVVKNSKTAQEEIIDICKVNNIKTAIMGESRNYKGNENTMMGEARPFAAGLEKRGLTVIFEPEVLSTLQAERIQGKKEDIDASAAAIILQSYLDRQAHKKSA